MRTWSLKKEAPIDWSGQAKMTEVISGLLGSIALGNWGGGGNSDGAWEIAGWLTQEAKKIAAMVKMVSNAVWSVI